MPRPRPQGDPKVTNNDDTPEPEVVKPAKPRTSRKVDTPDTGVIETKEEPQPAPVFRTDHREGVPNGLIIGQHDPLMLEGDDDGISITVTRDVYRKVYPYGSRRPSYILLYPRGAKVAKSLLQRQAKG